MDLSDFFSELLLRPFMKLLGIFYLYLVFWRPAKVQRILIKHFDNSFSEAGSRITFGIMVAAFGLGMLGLLIIAIVSAFR